MVNVAFCSVILGCMYIIFGLKLLEIAMEGCLPRWKLRKVAPRMVGLQFDFRIVNRFIVSLNFTYRSALNLVQSC